MAEEGQVIACHSVEQWTAELAKGNQAKKLIVVNFTTTWCGPCRAIAPVVTELAKKFPNVIFLKVDVDELETVASDWAVRAMPTFMFVKAGEIVHEFVGGNKEKLLIAIEKHAITV